MAERMNAFLRGHRVLSVRQRDFPEGWGFCVEKYGVRLLATAIDSDQVQTMVADEKGASQ